MKNAERWNGKTLPFPRSKNSWNNLGCHPSTSGSGLTQSENAAGELHIRSSFLLPHTMHAKIAKVGTKTFFICSQIHKFLGLFCNRRSANFWGVQVRKSLIRKLVMINRNRKSANFLVVPLHKSANLQEKKAVQIRIGLPLNIFFWSAKPNQSKISFLHPIRLDEHGLVTATMLPTSDQI